jgi:hypothetical protein
MLSSRVSEMALDNFLFLTISETFKSSKTIVWFSRIISVDIVISNKNGKLFLLKLSYRKKYLSQSQLK